MNTAKISGGGGERPNVVLILNDDMGYSDLGCYGGEMRTPHLDRLAGGGLRYTQFYNTARCCPSRASLLTGLHPHQADVGHMIGNDQLDGYLGDLSRKAATIAEVLGTNGYHTCMSGKWHVSGKMQPGEEANWPCQRGFDEYYGMLCGAASYYAPKFLKRNNTPIEAPASGPFYFTDAISDEAVGQLRRHFSTRPDQPFFQYVAYTAPHWPLHAKEEDIAACRGRFDEGWDVLRAKRLRRMVEMGLLGEGAELSPRDPTQPPWEDEAEKSWQARRMEVYAAQIESMDAGIGRILEELEDSGQLDNTLIIFLADNGGCAENIPPGSNKGHSASAQSHTRDGRPVRFGNDPSIIPGGEDTYASYGVPWANLSNTPFRKYKHWVHEGGIATPFIVHWPAGMKARNAIRHQPAQLPDVMATIVDVTAAAWPQTIGDRRILPHEGFSMRPTFDDDQPHQRDTLTWEHEGNCAIRQGRWKLVREHTPTSRGGIGPHPWELYDIDNDRSELHDLAAAHPDVVARLEHEWNTWAARCNVRPYEEVLKRRAANHTEQSSRAQPK